ncbi:hypothetical protein PV04_04637 [Phialophora macrospora]|uniref:Uncharacterized protein n=1 Tax=Phialophora macrospora TaxID=1851006 RepID=A0A0D2FKQ8_9EURO|nr:hypothetical protein PV04_04637 [Phialophora macrospora]
MTTSLRSPSESRSPMWITKSDPLRNDCNLPDGDPQGLDCHITSVDVIAARQDLPLGLTSITVGTGTTPSGSTISLTLPYSANLNPSGSLSGAGMLVLSSPIRSAVLDSSDVSQSSRSAFSKATCDFYAGSATVAGLVACTGDVVGSGSTNSEVSLSALAGCVACSYTTGEAGSFVSERARSSAGRHITPGISC